MVPQTRACRLLGLGELFAVLGDATEIVEISASFFDRSAGRGLPRCKILLRSRVV
jgi:hypothetical protein